MFSDHKAAKQISDRLLEMSGLLTESVGIMNQSECSQEEKITYRKFVGRLLANVADDALNLLYWEHPDLKPEEYYLPPSNKQSL